MIDLCSGWLLKYETRSLSDRTQKSVSGNNLWTVESAVKTGR